MPTYELPFFLPSELGRAQAQLAESLAHLPASGAETKSRSAIAAPRRQHRMKSCFASAAYHDFMSEVGQAVRGYRLNDN